MNKIIFSHEHLEKLSGNTVRYQPVHSNLKTNLKDWYGVSFYGTLKGQQCFCSPVVLYGVFQLHAERQLEESCWRTECRSAPEPNHCRRTPQRFALSVLGKLLEMMSLNVVGVRVISTVCALR